LPEGRALQGLTRDILALDEGLDRFIADSAEEAGVQLSDLVSNDDNLLLEYQTPRGNVLPWSAREELVKTLREYHDATAVAELEMGAPALATGTPTP